MAVMSYLLLLMKKTPELFLKRHLLFRKRRFHRFDIFLLWSFRTLVIQKSAKVYAPALSIPSTKKSPGKKEIQRVCSLSLMILIIIKYQRCSMYIIN